MARTIKKAYNFRNNKKAIFILLIPAILVYSAFEVFPILQSFYISFFKWNGIVTVPLKFVGFNNYKDLLTNSYFPLALKNTLWFMVLSTVLQLTVAFILALVLSKALKGYKLFKTLFFIPQVLCLSGVAIIWYFIFFPGTGPLTTLLTQMQLGGIARNWLADKSTAINSIIVVNSWISIGFYMMILYSAITGISEDVLEYSEIDGSKGLHRVFNIIIPMIWDIIKVTLVMEVTGNLKIFEIVFIMTKGGPDGLTNTLGTLLYNEAFLNNHFGVGSAISTTIFILSIVLTLMSMKIMQKETI